MAHENETMGIGQQIQSCRQKSNNQQKKNLKYENQLAPMDMLDTLKFDVDTFSDGDAQGKKQKRHKVRIARTKSLSIMLWLSRTILPVWALAKTFPRKI